jgi:hypothetical protein
MVSKTSLTELVRAFDVDGVLAGLDARPDLLGVRDDKGRTWLHLAAAQPVEGDPARAAATVALAEGLLARGLDIDAAAFTEGEWRATALWFSVSRGRNPALGRVPAGAGLQPRLLAVRRGLEP